jgi:hypothetical protein
MQRKIKLAIAIILAGVFGIFGFTTAYSTIMQSPEYAFGALLPFILCFGVCLDQIVKMRKETLK